MPSHTPLATRECWRHRNLNRPRARNRLETLPFTTRSESIVQFPPQAVTLWSRNDRLVHLTVSPLTMRTRDASHVDAVAVTVVVAAMTETGTAITTTSAAIESFKSAGPEVIPQASTPSPAPFKGGSGGSVASAHGPY